MKKIYRSHPYLALSLLCLMTSSFLLILYLAIFQTLFMGYIVLGFYGVTLLLYLRHLVWQIKEKLKQKNPSA